jgi:DNA-binding response OmpR family regulator
MFMSRRCPPAQNYRYKILYVGTNCALVQRLNRELKQRECFVDYCPAVWLAHVLLKSDIKYALLLFDDELAGTTGKELTQFARALAHRQQTPIIVITPDEAAGGRDVGANVLLRKPDDASALTEAIMAACKRL